MEEIFVVLSALFLVVAAITVVGHGLWLLAAFIWRALVGGRTKSASRPSHAKGGSEPRGATPADHAEELAVTSRQVSLLWQAGLIDDDVYREVTLAIQSGRRRLEGVEVDLGPAREEKATETPPHEEAEAALSPGSTPRPTSPPRSELPGSTAPEGAPALAGAESAAVVGRGPPVEAAAPVRSRRSPGEIFAAFLEEKNIRWGEIVGGLLVLFSSGALVVSLWARIEESQFLKFFLFTAVTAAVFGVGLYTAKNWKIPLTSRGLLILATLLVPLDFLALAAFARVPGAGDLWLLSGEALAVLVFTWLTWRAGRVLAAPWPGLVTVGVVGASVSMLLSRRWGSPGLGTWAVLALAAATLIAYGATTFLLARAVSRWRYIGKLKAQTALSLLGVTAFASGLALALLGYKLALPSDRLSGFLRLAPAVAVYAVPWVFCGLLLTQRLRRRRHFSVALAGSSVAVLGVFLGLASVTLALHDTRVFIAVCLLHGAVGLVLAFGRSLPLAGALGGFFAGLAWVTIIHVTRGLLPAGEVESRDFILALVSGPTGNALLGLGILFAVGAAILGWRLRFADAAVQGGLAGVAIFCGIALVTWHGFAVEGDPLGVTWTYAVAAAVAFAGALPAPTRSGARAAIVGIGSVLLLGSLVQGFAYRLEEALRPYEPVLFAFLVYASLTLLAADLGSGPRGRSFPGGAVLAFRRSAAAAASVALLWLVFAVLRSGVVSDMTGLLARRGLWLALVWLGLALVAHSRSALVLAQTVGTAAAGLFAFAILREETWFQKGVAGNPFLHPATWWTLGLWVGGLQVLTVVARLLERLRKPQPEPRFFTAPGAASVDFLASAALAGSFFVLLVFSVLEAIYAERFGPAPPRFRLTSAFGAHAWGVWGLLFVYFLLGLCERIARNRYVFLLLVLWSAALLVAGSAYGTGYTYLALEYVLVGYVLALSATLWFRGVALRRLQESRPGLLLEARRSEHGPWIQRTTTWILHFFGTVPAIGLAVLATALFFDTPAAPSGNALLDWVGERNAYVIPLFILSACLAGQAIRERRRVDLLFAGALTNLGGSLLWLSAGAWPTMDPLALTLDLGALNAAILAVTGLAALCLEHTFLVQESPTREGFAFSRQSLVGSLVLFTGSLAFSLAADAVGEPLPTTGWLSWGSCAAVLALVLVSIRLRHQLGAAAALVFMALLAPALALERLDLEAWQIWWWLTLLCGVHLATVRIAWNRVPALQSFLFGSPQLRKESNGAVTRFTGFLTAWSGIATFLVFSCSLAIVLSFRPAWLQSPSAVCRWWRLGAALTLAFPMAACLVSTKHNSAAPRFWAAFLGLALALFSVWSLIEPSAGAAKVATYASTAMMVATVVAALYAMGAIRDSGPWRLPLRGGLVTALILLFLAFLIILDVEFQAFRNGLEPPLQGPLNVGVLVCLVLASVAPVAAALDPRHDPFSLQAAGRSGYVYAAEVALALAAAQVRLSMPWLFHGFFERYWPLIVMLIAYLGVGLGEILRRRQQFVVALPLQRTGLFLPLFPVLAYWWLESAVHYTGLLLCASVLYAGLSMFRRSLLLAVLASLLANVGLCHLYSQTTGLGFHEHPQLWLAPVALAVLLASYWHRGQVPASRLASIRYSCLLTIYVSSTADIFLNGVESSAWLPLLLAVLAAFGVFTGILARLRSFLFTGASFLVMALVTLIWHAAAARGWTWLWYVGGIFLGLAIIAVFALLERRRAEVQGVLRRLREWGD